MTCPATNAAGCSRKCVGMVDANITSCETVGMVCANAASRKSVLVVITDIASCSAKSVRMITNAIRTAKLIIT